MDGKRRAMAGHADLHDGLIGIGHEAGVINQLGRVGDVDGVLDMEGLEFAGSADIEDGNVFPFVQHGAEPPRGHGRNIAELPPAHIPQDQQGDHENEHAQKAHDLRSSFAFLDGDGKSGVLLEQQVSLGEGEFDAVFMEQVPDIQQHLAADIDHAGLGIPDPEAQFQIY